MAAVKCQQTLAHRAPVTMRGRPLQVRLTWRGPLLESLAQALAQVKKDGGATQATDLPEGTTLPRPWPQPARPSQAATGAAPSISQPAGASGQSQSWPAAGAYYDVPMQSGGPQVMDPPPQATYPRPRLQMPAYNGGMAGVYAADGMTCPVCQRFIRGGRAALNQHQFTSSTCAAAAGEREFGREPCQYCGKMLAAGDEWAARQHAAYCPGQRQQQPWPREPPPTRWRSKGKYGW